MASVSLLPATAEVPKRLPGFEEGKQRERNHGGSDGAHRSSAFVATRQSTFSKCRRPRHSNRRQLEIIPCRLIRKSKLTGLNRGPSRVPVTVRGVKSQVQRRF
ncbi:unnamed protein product [Calypogeia fissa]